MAERWEKRVAVRHGRLGHPNNPIREAVVSDGFLWLGTVGNAGAFVSGDVTLRNLRDALTEMIDRKSKPKRKRPSPQVGDGRQGETP